MFIPNVIQDIILDYVQQLQYHTGLNPILREIRQRYRTRIVEATFADPQEQGPYGEFDIQLPDYFVDDYSRFRQAFFYQSGYLCDSGQRPRDLEKFKKFLIKTSIFGLYPWEVTKRK